MTQSIYTQTCNCEKPLPLIKTNFLSEFRTEIEKAKARAALGIADDQTLKWENIAGHIEDNHDIQDYLNKLFEYVYHNDYLSKDLSSIQDALDFTLDYIVDLESLGLSMSNLKDKCLELETNLNALIELINGDAELDANNIQTIIAAITTINGNIQTINTELSTLSGRIDVLERMKLGLQSSHTISLQDTTETVDEQEVQKTNIEVKVSQKEKNATTTEEDGVYTPDLTGDIEDINTHLGTIDGKIEQFSGTLSYNSDLDDDTQSPTIAGVKVKDLRDKSLTDIIDLLYFPPKNPTPIQPNVTYSNIPSIVEVGTTITAPTYTYNAGNGGANQEPVSTLTYNGTVTDKTVYDEAGTYVFKTEVTYGDGEYLKNNRGEETTIRVEAGTTTVTKEVLATYPWYADGNKQTTLVPIGIISEEMTFATSGVTVVAIPGSRSELVSFKLDAGLGLQDVNLGDWNKSTSVINNIVYTTYTKKSAYLAAIQHYIKFKILL